MNLPSTARKTLSTLGMLAVGDAIAFALRPRSHLRVWSFRRAPRWYRRVSSALIESRPRSLAAAGFELAVGAGLLALAERRA